mmetsp:Transcript_82/g.123  ORF Transcript_82/g.123 Transcript_82/m.123 type:complete len:887 (-) Transcript_82:43-2703(-)
MESSSQSGAGHHVGAGEGESVEGVSYVDGGGVEVDLGETFLQIHSSGNVDINVKKNEEQRPGRAAEESSHRSPIGSHAFRRGAFVSSESDSLLSSQDVDNYLKEKGFDPDAINDAAALAAGSVDGASGELGTSAIDLDSSLEARLNRLESLLEREVASPEVGKGAPQVQESVLESGLGESEHLEISRSSETSDMEKSLGDRMERLDKLLESSPPPVERSYVDKPYSFVSNEDDHEGDYESWAKVNRMLEGGGFNAVPLGSNGLPDVAGLCGELAEVLNQFERRGKSIEQLTVEARNPRAGGSDTKLEKAQLEIGRLERQLREAENHLREAREDSQASHRGDASQLRKLQQENASLQQKLSLSEHRVKAKEAVLERLQRKLEGEVKRQDTSKDRSRDLFEKIEHRSPRPSSQKDQKLMQTIQAFDEEREKMKEDAELLKAEIRRLNKLIQDKDNVLNGSMESTLHLREQEIMQKAKNVEHDQRAYQSALDERERAVVAKMSRLELQLTNVLNEKERCEEHIDNLKLELASRPTMRDWKSAQRQIARLESQVQSAVEALEEQDIEAARANNIFVPSKKKSHQKDQLSAREKVELMAKRAVSEQQDNRKRTSTAEMIRRDKQNHRLGLNRLTALPKSAAHDILQQLCRVLEIGDVEMLVPAVQKMCWVVRAMPKLEHFVKEVSSFVLLHGDDTTLSKRGGTAALNDVLPQLKRWVNGIRKLNLYTSFRSSIMEELKRSSGLKSGNTPGSLTDDQMVFAIRELVTLEQDMMRNKEVFHASEEYMKQHPELALTRCVSYFQELFSVRNLEGVMPKINETYLFVEELTNFVQVLRPTLGLPPSASLHSCLAKIQEFTLDTPVRPTQTPVVGETSETDTNIKSAWYLPQWDEG